MIGFPLGRLGGFKAATASSRVALRDVAAEHIENQIDSADVFQGVVAEVDCLRPSR